MESIDDTIVAISTPIGLGAIAIVRMSGRQSIEIADRLFFSPKGKPSEFPSHTIHYGKIRQEDRVVDQVMLALYRAPRSYTTEDVVEIHCHGGPVTAQIILSLCQKQGARLAKPGEFTKRALLHGRIDLTQAEAVMDVISASSESAQAMAARSLEGQLSHQILIIYDKLKTILAALEADIDFSEQDLAGVTISEVATKIHECISLGVVLQKNANTSRIVRNGISVVIAGRTNVGKSSIMNALLARGRSIVAPFPGTTRDFIEDTITIAGISIRLIDTAGYRHSRGVVETFGIKKTLTLLEQAELILLVLDGSRPFSRLDDEMIRFSSKKPVLYVLNKCDLPSRLHLPNGVKITDPLQVSAKTGQGIENLRNTIRKIVTTEIVDQNTTQIMINERQATAINSMIEHLREASKMINHGEHSEIICQQIQFAIASIENTIHAKSSPQIIDHIFESFCIGK